MERYESFKAARARLASELYDRPSLERQAAGLIESRRKPEHDDWQLEPKINARTAIFEELTAKGHLSHVEFDEPPEIVNQRTLRRLINGWSDSLPVWEMERRLHEITEELTIHRVWEDIKSGRLPKDTLVITLSDFPEMCPDDVAPKIGYRALNRKGMVRVTEFKDSRRVIEQISRSNSNDGSSERFFALNGFVIGEGSSRTLANQIIATKSEFPDGVIDIQKALDGLSGPQVIYGEYRSQEDLQVPGYEDLRAVSAAREAQTETFTELLAQHEQKLNRQYRTGKITYAEKLKSFNRRRKQLVDEICTLDPSYARDARGEAAVVHFEQASLAMASGDHTSGAAHLERALAAADPNAGVVCGGEIVESTKGLQAKEAAQTYREAWRERRNWKWKEGVCVVKQCPSRPHKTEVGPCSVCRNCQRVFDNGKDPQSIYKTAGFWEVIIQAFMESRQRREGKHAELQRRKPAA